MALCAHCSKPLTISVQPDSDDEQEDPNNGSMDVDSDETVPDDVHLPCGDHFHWECLLEAYEYTTCPKCNQSIVSSPPGNSSNSEPEERIIVNLNNEGGLQEQIDILPILKEESYLRAYPEERKSRAFLEFCAQGDHRGIAALLNSCIAEDDDDDDDEPTKSPEEILRYQDPLNNNSSGLHVACANGHREVAWLLLLLASEYPELEFPALVYQEAAALGVMREEQTGKVDIRSLKDTNGRTAEDVAREVGVIWNGWVEVDALSLLRTIG
ncbi:hypothetical protein LTR97_002556 [Elasticomyces elasticus]|uniref:RING-type domain-containing protein n=1 Tax=Elasticomyces elasticus TaxID=574655 RepID=A0AAN7WBN6_9PEZI|nr:hypothetical protein LTR97_002556 [Elasticomyces elasticus]